MTRIATSNDINIIFFLMLCDMFFSLHLNFYLYKCYLCKGFFIVFSLHLELYCILTIDMKDESNITVKSFNLIFSSVLSLFTSISIACSIIIYLHVKNLFWWTFSGYICYIYYIFSWSIKMLLIQQVHRNLTNIECIRYNQYMGRTLYWFMHKL